MHDLFRENGVAGMMEEINYSAKEMVSPDLGVVKDCCSGESATASVKPIFTKYSIILNTSHCRNTYLG